MRIIWICMVFLIFGLTFDRAQADPYRWCAVYGGGRSGGSANCYFMTLEQCSWAISGNGGFCQRNLFYDGRPVVTPEESIPRRRKPPPKMG